MAAFVTHVAADHDRPAGHASRRLPRIRAADQMTGVATNFNRAAMHLGPQPIIDVSLDADFTAAHLAADVPSGVAQYVNPTARHAGADPLDALQRAAKLQPAIGGIARYGKRLGQRQSLVAMLHWQSLDLRERQIGQCVGQDPVDFNRHRGVQFVMRVLTT